MTSFVTVVFADASLNPLSPCPGMTFPLRESWFLFSFSSFLSAVAFGILSTTKAFPFTADVAFATSSFVAVSFAATAFAFANSAFADSIAEAVFSVDATFSKAASKRAIAASNLLVSAFVVGADGCSTSDAGVAVAGVAGCSTSDASFSKAGAVGCSVAGVATVDVEVSVAATVVAALCTSVAETAPFPKNIKPAAIATDAAPKLYLRIP